MIKKNLHNLKLDIHLPLKSIRIWDGGGGGAEVEEDRVEVEEEYKVEVELRM